VDRTALVEMLQTRIADGSLLRLIGKCLHVGVLDGEEHSRPDLGTAQGSVLSPILGNVYLHYVLDLWFETEVKPRLRGRATLLRYCDDFVIGFEREDDARRVMALLGERLGRFGLPLHPDKTRLLPFRRPPAGQRRGKGPATFDFLGFTVYWERSRMGRWRMGCKTQSARLRRAVESVHDWCRCHRHLSVQDQHAALGRRLRGHFNWPAYVSAHHDELLRSKAFSAISSGRLLTESRTAPAAAVVAERAGSMMALTVLHRARTQRTTMFFATATALASMRLSSPPLAWEANRSAPSLWGSADTAAAGWALPTTSPWAGAA
jgi:hypothetical protein